MDKESAYEILAKRMEQAGGSRKEVEQQENLRQDNPKEEPGNVRASDEV